MSVGSKHPAGRPWSQEEIKQLLKLRREKRTFLEIAEYLNRTVKGVQAGWYKYSIPEDRRATGRIARALYLKEHRAKPRDQNGAIVNVVKAGPRIPEQTIQDWKLRAAAPKTLTGMIFGDPPIGFSALDMRGQQ